MKIEVKPGQLRRYERTRSLYVIIRLETPPEEWECMWVKHDKSRYVGKHLTLIAHEIETYDEMIA